MQSSPDNQAVKDLEAHLRASYKLIHFCTQEEKRAEESLLQLARSGKPREYYSWTATDSVRDVNGKTPANCKEGCNMTPEKALDWVIARERQNGLKGPPSLYVFKDLHPFIGGRSAQAVTIRKLKDTVQVLQETFSAVVLLSPTFDIPPELEKDLVIIDFKLPTAEELQQKFVELIDSYKGQPGVEINLNNRDLDDLAQAAKGLTLNEAERAFGKIFTRNRGKLNRADIPAIADEKKQIVRKTGILSIEEPIKMEEVGGLEILVKWLEKRKEIFTQEARNYGIPAPKGILLTGVPGCGKSLCARAMASFWNIPLLRLDMGAVFGSLVGASEANMRRAIQSAEAMAPCILMIDEIEKGLAGMSGGGGGDSGTGSRVFGSLLSWMNDKTAPVFVVATANQFDRLPPEMLRKGRFDELFFVDFPHAGERQQIFKIHVEKALKRHIPALDATRIKTSLDTFGFTQVYEVKRGKKDGGAETVKGTVVQLSNNFTGSEIEEAVKTAMIEAFANDRRPFTAADIARAIAQTVPLIDTMSEDIERLRARARKCTVSASRYPTGGEEPTLIESTPPPTQSDQASPAPSRGGRPMYEFD